MCVAPQHAGCTGHVENCVTTVFAVYLTTSGQAWADLDVFMSGRGETDRAPRRAAGISGGLERKTKPQLADDQLERLLKVGQVCRYPHSAFSRDSHESPGFLWSAHMILPKGVFS